MTKDYRQLRIQIAATFIDAIGSALFVLRKKPSIDRKKVKSVALVKLDRIGDTFLAEPTVAAMRGLFPHARVTMIVAPWNKSVLEHNPAIDELVVFSDALDVQKESFTSFLKKENVRPLVELLAGKEYDVVVDLQGNPLNVLAMWRSGIPLRVGMKGKLLSFLLTHAAPYSGGQHQSAVYFSVARLLGAVGEMPLPKIYPSLEDKTRAAAFIEKHECKQCAVFHLGAGRSYRQWPLERFIALAREMRKKYPDMECVVVGGKDDIPMGNAFADGVAGAVNAAGELLIPQTYALLQKADLFVGSESGPAHLAGALGIPTVVFMSLWSGIERWKPLGNRVAVCASKEVHACPGISCVENPCPNMAAITVAEAMDAVEKLILQK